MAEGMRCCSCNGFTSDDLTTCYVSSSLIRSIQLRILLKRRASSSSAVCFGVLSIPHQKLIRLYPSGEHLIWTEQTHSSNLDSIVWPRAASSAEVFWSGPGGNVSAALPRLHDVAFRMTQRGIGAIALQPLWCALRPGACDINA